MKKTDKPKPVDLVKALQKFGAILDECMQDCQEAEYAIRNSDDKFWLSLWNHPTLWSLFFGISGAVIPIGLLMLWHISKGGVLSI